MIMASELDSHKITILYSKHNGLNSEFIAERLYTNVLIIREKSRSHIETKLDVIEYENHSEIIPQLEKIIKHYDAIFIIHPELISMRNHEVFRNEQANWYENMEKSRKSLKKLFEDLKEFNKIHNIPIIMTMNTYTNLDINDKDKIVVYCNKELKQVFGDMIIYKEIKKERY